MGLVIALANVRHTHPCHCYPCECLCGWSLDPRSHCIPSAYIRYILVPRPHSHSSFHWLYGTGSLLFISVCGWFRCWPWDYVLHILKHRPRGNVLRWMPWNLTNDRPTLVQIQAWCRQIYATRPKRDNHVSPIARWYLFQYMNIYIYIQHIYNVLDIKSWDSCIIL